MSTKKLISLLFALLVSLSALAEEAALLNPQHPDSYTVVKGDTLWDIAGRFLSKPWRWPEVWKGNPQIKNPDLIYPGDVITLTYVNGKPELRANRDGGRGSTIKLSPTVREEPFVQPVPTIPIGAVQQFLNLTRVLSREEYDNAPYIVSSAGEHLVTTVGNSIYVKNLVAPTSAGGQAPTYSIYRLGVAYRDPVITEDGAAPAKTEDASFGYSGGAASNAESVDKKDKEDADILGYEGVYVGEARLEASGDPATLILTHATREALNGDRLFAVEQEEIRQNYLPHPPSTPLQGRIISVVDGVSRIGQFQSVAINLGARDGVEVGHVFAAYRAGEVVRNDVTELRGDTVQLPDERTGILMVFRTFERMSYALVMEASGPLKVQDVVRNP
jgi:hypothetical protein